MAGSTEQGKNAASTNKERYDHLYPNDGGFYGHIGKIGGALSHGGGFSKDRNLAVTAGRKGGLTSRRIGPHQTIPCESCDHMFSSSSSLRIHARKYHRQVMA